MRTYLFYRWEWKEKNAWTYLDSERINEGLLQSETTLAKELIGVKGVFSVR